MKRKQLIFISIISSLTILFVIGFYIFTFYKSAISNNPSDWGGFGDFLGGVLNPIIGIVNIIILIYVAIIVSKNEERRWLSQFIYDEKQS